LVHFSDENRKTTIINKHGKEKYDQIIRDLKDPNRIELTHDTILPDFITNAINQLKEETILVH
jgi:predicted membrane-bound spermidine synthase